MFWVSAHWILGMYSLFKWDTHTWPAGSCGGGVGNPVGRTGRHLFALTMLSAQYISYNPSHSFQDDKTDLNTVFALKRILLVTQHVCVQTPSIAHQNVSLFSEDMISGTYKEKLSTIQVLALLMAKHNKNKTLLISSLNFGVGCTIFFNKMRRTNEWLRPQDCEIKDKEVGENRRNTRNSMLT